MKSLIILILLCVFPVSGFSTDLYPLAEFEIVAVESSPSDLNLSMSLSEILQSIENSDLEQKKKALYDIVLKHLVPLLNEQDTTNGVNYLKLITQLPVRDFVDDLHSRMSVLNTNNHDSDFIVAILPRTPKEALGKSAMPFSKFYSHRKAAVIDVDALKDVKEARYNFSLNQKIERSINFAFQKHQKENLYPFFLGALLRFHLSTNNSRIDFQLLAGLPTDLKFPLGSPIDEYPATFSEFRGPQSSLVGQDQPTVLLSSSYHFNREKPLDVSVDFGEWIEVDNDGFVINQKPQKLDDLTLAWKDQVGVSSLFYDYKVPSLYGTFQGIGGRFADLQANIHHVDLDLANLSIKNMHITVDVPTFFGLFELPTFEVPFVSEKFRDGGNEKLEPYKDQIASLFNDTGEILTNKQVQAELIALINTLLSGEQQVSSL